MLLIKEANRKTLNVWNLELQKQLIIKHTNILGIELIEIKPQYTSFIGNILNNYFDPTNASIEICRRGMYQFDKGFYYPCLAKTIIDTTLERSDVLLDVQDIKDCQTWISFYTKLINAGFRYRKQLGDVDHYCSSMKNKKSNVKLITFD